MQKWITHNGTAINLARVDKISLEDDWICLTIANDDNRETIKYTTAKDAREAFQALLYHLDSEKIWNLTL